MRQIILLLGITLFIQNYTLQAQVAPDCVDAIPVCQNSYAFNGQVGAGNDPNEISPNASCLNGENNSIWFEINVLTSGTLSFVVLPNVPSEDYNWALYDLTFYTCADISSGIASEVQCNASPDLTAPASAYSTAAGATGAFSNSPYFGDIGFYPSFVGDITVNAGERYLLYVQDLNSASGQGFSIDFSNSTAGLFSANSVPNLDSAYVFSCGSNYVDIEFNAPIKCSSLQTTDFSVTTPTGATITPNSISPYNCQAGGTGLTNGVTLFFNAFNFNPGTYTANLIDNIENACGNVNNNSNYNFGVAQFTVDAGSDYTFCVGDTINISIGDILGSSDAGGYSWTASPANWLDSLSFPFSPYPTVSAQNVQPDTIMYILTLQGFGGNTACTAMDTVYIYIQDCCTNFDAQIANFDNVGCFGASTGSATATATGSISNPNTFKYEWNTSPVQISPTATGLSANTTYIVTVSDNNQCSDTAQITLTQPNAPINVNIVGSMVSCVGGNNGTINTTITGGTSPYNFNWSGGLPSIEDPFNVSAGNYNVTVTDVNNCTITGSTTVTEPAAPLVVEATGSAIPCGATGGDITTTITGGGTPYSISWNNNLPPSQNQFNVPVGVYEITVTDAFQCTVTDTAAVTSIGSLSATASVTDASCNNIADGAITLNVTGGNQPYTFNWDNGLPATQNQTNLFPGVYTVTVTEAQSPTGAPPCSFVVVSTVSTNSNIVLSPTVSDVSCHGAMDGAVQLGATGGVSPYLFNWSNSATTQNINNLNGGNYSVTVTDGAGCQVSTSATVFEPSDIVIISTPTDVSCHGGSDGTIILNVSGGMPPTSGGYIFNWSNNLPPTQNQAGLTAGTYTVTVVDVTQCTKTASITINEPAPIVLSTTTTDVTCGNTNNGSIMLSITGGTPPYNFTWDNGVPPLQNPTNLTPGTYNVTVTDAQQCTATTAATINAQGNISLSATSTNATCSNSSDGSIQLNISGGLMPYTINWDNGLPPTQNQNNLAAGAYTVTVIDANQCSNVLTETITAPPALNVTGVGNPVSCNGNSDGSIQLTVTGGTPNYTFTWSGGLPAVQNPTNVAAGTYFVTVTDANQCTMNSIVIVNQPDAIQLSTSVVQPSCLGSANGSINLTVTGGTQPYTYQWDNGVSPVQNPTNLNPGTYSVTVTDVNQCTQTTMATLTGTTNITTTITPTDATCLGGNNGAINVTASGGTSPYTFTWSDPSIGNTGNPTNLTTGLYLVTITDANQCIDTTSATVGAGSDITLTIVDMPPSCVPNGSIAVTPSGGVAPYAYTWSANANTGNSSTANNLDGGTYSVTVADANGCTTVSNDIVFNATSNLQIQGTVIQPRCTANSGIIALATLSGASPFTFQWSANTPQLDTNIVQNLSGGNYFVTVTDDNGCDTIMNFTLNNAVIFDADSTVQAENCGQGDGSITYTILTGTPPYTYNWDNGGNTNTIANLPAGDYAVTITDGDGCTITDVATVPGSSGVTAAPTFNDPVCGNDGTIDLNVTSGIAPFQYTWSNNANTGNTSTATDLNGGIYTVTVTDALNCSNNYVFNLNSPSLPNIQLEELMDNECFGGADGFIEVSVTNAPNPVSYQWSNNVTTNQLTNLTSGNYTVTITDNVTGCQISQTFTINEPDEIILDLQDNVVITAGSELVLEVPNPQNGVLYSWSGSDGTQVSGPMITVFPQGLTTYTVTASIEGCTSISQTITVSISEVGAVAVPEAFSPNNDGKNDLFRVFSIDSKVEVQEFRIFNRWGQLIYSNLNGEWDGTHEGKNVPNGSYVYYIVVQLADGTTQELVGDVLLVR